MKVFVSPEEEIFFKAIANSIFALVKKKPNCVIALPTGSTPVGLYNELVKKFEQGRIDFSKTVFINLDEYAGLGQSHQQSYSRFLRKHFLDKINASEKNILLFNGKAADLNEEAAQREKFVSASGIDLALLGIGENAHIAFNEPGSGEKTRTRVVDLTASTIEANSRFFSGKGDVPTQAITMGIGTILKAKKIVLMAIGAKKADAVKKMRDSKPSGDIPASFLQLHKDIEVYCDKEAGALLENVLPVELNGTKIYFEQNLPRGKNIVFISPHPDDSAIAAGATLSMLAKNNNVFVFVMSSGHHAVLNGEDTEKKIALRESESSAEAQVLGTTPVFLRLGFYDNGEKNFVIDRQRLLQEFEKAKPDIVFLPQERDTHPTHAFSRRLAVEALAKTSLHAELWNYETPWALFSHGTFNAITDFSRETLEKKITAIKSHASQTRRTRFDVAAHDIARFRAISIAEQILSDFGENPLKIRGYLELFAIEKK